jgi:hypothetical protein
MLKLARWSTTHRRASAVFLDALVVCCLMLPAVLHLIGRRTWSLPAGLDRVLPRLNIQGTVLPSGETGGIGGAPPSGSRRGGRREVGTEGAEG